MKTPDAATKPVRPAQGTRDVLKPFAKLYAHTQQEFEQGVRNLSDEDLVRLIEGVPDFTATNCWWAEYDAIRFLKKMVEREIRRRV